MDKLKLFIKWLNKPIPKRTAMMQIGILLVIFFGIIDYIYWNTDDIKLLFFPEILMVFFIIFAYITSPKDKNNDV